MSNQTKKIFYCFPLWKPFPRNKEKFYGFTRKAFKMLRDSSSNFTKKKDVISAIKHKSNNKCAFCGSSENLQIDHIITVYQAFNEKRYIKILNAYGNLQILCASCNSSKPPEGENNG